MWCWSGVSRAPAWQHVLILISWKSWILLIISTQNNPVGWEVFSSMAAIYTSSFLRSLSSSIQTNNRLAPDLWQRLTSLGLSRVKPVRRGLHGGNRRRQVLPRHGTVLESSMGQPLSSYGSFQADFPGKKVNLNGESNLKMWKAIKETLSRVLLIEIEILLSSDRRC